MTPLTVEVAGERRTLTPGTQLMFGRDESCDVCLDPKDLGISRIAGRLWHDGDRWIVSNLSRKRALHVVDSTGFAMPLPVHAAQAPAGQRVIDQPTLTVLVAGDLWTHCPRPDLSAALRPTTSRDAC